MGTVAANGAQRLITIRVKNPADCDVLVTDTSGGSGTYCLAEHFDKQALSFGQLKEGMIPHFTLKLGQDKDLILMPEFKGVMSAEALENRSIRVAIYWRGAIRPACRGFHWLLARILKQYAALREPKAANPGKTARKRYVP